jgi:hypothetical protein
MFMPVVIREYMFNDLMADTDINDFTLWHTTSSAPSDQGSPNHP